MHPLTCAASKPSTHASHTAPTLPGRVHTRSLSTRDHLHPTLAPGRPQSCCPHVLGEGWRLPGSQETNFGSTSTCSLRSSQCYHARLVSLLAWHPARESDVEDQVPPPQAPPPFALTAAQPSPPAPPYVCRVQPKHPCIAPRAQPARAVPVPRPEHARTHQPPCRPHVAGAHVSGTGWRLPACEKTFFGAISTCASASSQRCHVRVRLLPCAVASCCLPWCLAVMPVRGRW